MPVTENYCLVFLNVSESLKKLTPDVQFDSENESLNREFIWYYFLPMAMSISIQN
jgi:hypothetical protein